MFTYHTESSIIIRLLFRIIRINHRRFVLSSQCLNKSYTQTLNLPQSNFPMKHSRKLELNLEQQNVKFEDLFGISSQQRKCGKFLLHDGPPYANGDAHFGHAINRILKDIINKRKLLENFYVDFRPGWDCHGLPIELKAIPNNSDSRRLNPLEIRDRARRLAFNAIDRQRQAFNQWFLSANWSGIYRTMDLEYSIRELHAFYDMYRKGLIFRDRMPVYWSPSTRTALAEAELQYQTDHLSRAAFIRYPVVDQHYDALIWTTTPWTLLANEAIAFGERMNYCLIRIDGDNNQRPLLIARENLVTIQEMFKDCRIQIVQESISEFQNFRYQDPINGQCKSFLPSTLVTSSKGTGLIHIAPNHGQEDFKLMRQFFCKQPNSDNNHLMSKESIVDDDGRLRLPNNGGQSISIIDDNQASKYVLQNLLPKECVLYEHDYLHSYPYDWRSSKPVIIKPSDQWFLNMDELRDKCLAALSDVRLYPELLRKEMINQLSTRPNWCLSRQRKYGVPIPVFFDRKTTLPVLNDEIFQTLMKKFIQEGSLDIWWQQSPSELLAECPDRSLDLVNLEKSEDILDIWFDSGCSWLAVLGPDEIADLYLEGVDQIRGWFQSSLITSVALRGHAPYRSIIIHGFALDRDGYKMSKSLGNVINPMDIVNGNAFESNQQQTPTKKRKNSGDCGVDGLRLWIARNACTHNDVHVDLKEFQDDILTILNRFRNTYRFILGYLTKYSPSDHSFLIDYNNHHHHQSLPLIDQHLLYQTWIFDQKARKCYNEYRLGDLIEMMIHFFNYEFSTFYLSRIKDRLYCDSTESMDVRSIMTVLYYVYHTVGFHMAPILPHLIIECQQYWPFVHQAVIGNNNNNRMMKENLEQSELLLKQFQFIQSIIACINEWATSKHRLIDLDCHLSISANHPNVREMFATFQRFQPESSINDDGMECRSDLVECLQVARVSYGIDDNDKSTVNDQYYHGECLELRDKIPSSSNTAIESNHNGCQLRIYLKQTKNHQCPRCRRFTVINVHQNNLCLRCNFQMLHHHN
ncbi:Isoleucine--tRNA ligase, mitochondrial [Dermatophagoides farinae]|uniref:isoleucine--tRNA ligase n=1 Tax=Dermatophagoides farinae TaxID=6954 RepID=A0A922HQV1_DERFA|nr:Isoleucine--tRNA ligase, mitochondrial [Dermatophagoides farinae]